MRKGGGPKKGSAFEREIAKAIVKAFAHKNITQRDCWRSIGSGSHEIASGDLEMSRRLMKLFPFSVECKFRKKIHWENFLLRKKKSSEMRWVKQAIRGAEKIEGLIPLLILKENRKPIRVMFMLQLNTFRLMQFDRFLKNWVKGNLAWKTKITRS